MIAYFLFLFQKIRIFNHEPHEQLANLEGGEIYYIYACSSDRRIRGFLSESYTWTSR